MPQSDTEELARLIHKKLGLDVFPATLGDESGVVYDDPASGNYMVRVRYTTAAGKSLPPVVRMRATLPPNPGTAVLISYDKQGELAVLEGDYNGMLAQGINPGIQNAADPNIYGNVNQTAIVTALSHAIATPNVASLEVAVRAWIYVEDDIWHYFPGERVDLTSFVPAAGLHRLAGLYLKSDDTIEVFASTSKDLLDPLVIADVQEVHGQITAGSKPIWFWRLHDAQTSITDADSFLDGRQFINSITNGSASFDTLAPTTTKGDVIVHNGTVNVRLAVGSNGQALFADSAQSTGVKWAYPVKFINQGRLTLSSTDPAGEGTGKIAGTTVYWAPYLGQAISLYDGTSWVMVHTTSKSVAVPSTIARPFDIFGYLSSGDLALETLNWNAPPTAAITSISNASPPVVSTGTTPNLDEVVVIVGNSVGANNGVWRVGTVVAGVSFELKTLAGASPAAPGSVGTGGDWTQIDKFTSRATALATQDGVYVKSGDATRLYLGTGRTHSTSGQCTNQDAKRFLYNYYNRLRKIAKVVEETDTWTYGTAAWRPFNNNLANRVEMVVGVRWEDYVSCFASAAARPVSSSPYAVGIQRGGLSTNGSDVFNEINNSNASSVVAPTQTRFEDLPDAGYSFYQMLEYARNGTVTVHGDNGVATEQSGMMVGNMM